jgi:hypothetical protein
MADDVNKQKEKREKYSRRRRHDPDADIDYINERNMKFNQKLERFVIRLYFCRSVLPSEGKLEKYPLPRKIQNAKI